MIDSIRIDGLKELQKELRTLDKEWSKELRVASKAATDLISQATITSFRSRTGVAHEVPQSVKTLAQQRGASVRIGGANAPMALGSEFGSVRFNQFPAWRGNGSSAGYSLYESIRQKNDEVVDKYGDLIHDITKKAFPS